jgi:hypothetical protein
MDNGNIMSQTGNAVLVHGTLSDGTLTIGHGWAELPSGKVYDGASGAFYDKAEYYKANNAVAERTYTFGQMAKNMVKYKHYGPWHNGEGFVLGAKGRKDE